METGFEDMGCPYSFEETCFIFAAQLFTERANDGVFRSHHWHSPHLRQFSTELKRFFESAKNFCETGLKRRESGYNPFVNS